MNPVDAPGLLLRRSIRVWGACLDDKEFFFFQVVSGVMDIYPSFAIGKEEKNPMFLEKRVYQGSSGAVYPYPVVEKVEDEKHDRPWRAFFLENEYIKQMILPELGGRIQMAYDKIKKRHFVYYNQVIKPALAYGTVLYGYQFQV